jgi:hypothetical protein
MKGDLGRCDDCNCHLHLHAGAQGIVELPTPQTADVLLHCGFYMSGGAGGPFNEFNERLLLRRLCSRCCDQYAGPVHVD